MAYGVKNVRVLVIVDSYDRGREILEYNNTHDCMVDTSPNGESYDSPNSEVIVRFKNLTKDRKVIRATIEEFK